MTGKNRPKASSSIQKKVHIDVVSALREKREELELAQHKANSLNAEIQLMIAEALKEVGAPISVSIICLDCGAVRDKTQEACKACNEP